MNADDVKLTVRLPHDLWLQVRIAALKEGKSLQQIFEEAARAYIRKVKPKEENSEV